MEHPVKGVGGDDLLANLLFWFRLRRILSPFGRDYVKSRAPE